jgi:hypothetical protein
MDLHDDWKEFCGLLNTHEVEYLVVGAFALAFYGLPRLTGDIDFWVNPTKANAQRLASALAEFGFPSARDQVKQFAEPRQMWQIGVPPYRIDVITSIDGVNFMEAWADKVAGDLDGESVNYLSREHYLLNKRSTTRLKDKQDAERLAELLDEAEEPPGPGPRGNPA